MKTASRAEVVRLISETYGMSLHGAIAFLQSLSSDEKVPTKRELIAAMALQGLLSNPDVKMTQQASMVDQARTQAVNESYAKIATMVADALIAELEKTK